MPSSTSMPPPSTLPTRRNRINHSTQYPLSPPCSPDSTRPCELPSMRSLSKAATFHIPPSPPSDDAPFLSIPHLPRRSSTASKSLLALMLGKENEAAESIADFDRQFLGTRPSSPTGLSGKRAGLPLSERRQNGISPVNVDVKKSPRQSHEHLSDSGLGTSISSTSSRHRSVGADVESAADRLLLMGIASNVSRSEVDSASVKSVLDAQPQGSAIHSANNRHQPAHPRDQSQPIIPSALTHSISPSQVTTHNRPLFRSTLSSFARKKIEELVFEPILYEGSFGFFHPLVHSLEAQTRQTTIKCLRDLEKSLIFEPLRITKSPSLYRRFGEFSIQLVLDTYLHLSEPEQIRPTDRPYDNGYFLDLVQQVGRLATQISASRQAGQEGESAPTADDRITLEGGLGSTGDIAELVRWVDGVPYSLRTNKVYEPTPVMKRSASIMDEEVERSMARRKKGEIPQEMSCSDPDCDKVFTRKCDLAKHEKTHTRPFKCPEPSCKYHEQGLPTEKERDRHINDKHSKNPHYYHCQFCPFKTKRDSNCKQHMEKKHGWQYDRIKGNGKAKLVGTPAATPQLTPQTPNASTPISVDYSSMQDSTRPNSTMPTPVEQSLDSNPCPFESGTPVHLGGSLFNNGNRMMPTNTPNMYPTPQNQSFVAGTPYSAVSAITEQNLGMNTAELDMYDDNDQDFGMPIYDSGAAIATPFTPGYEMSKDVFNPTMMQMPMTPSTASGHHGNDSRNPSVSSTTPPTHPGLAQIISPHLPMEDDFMGVTAPSVINNQFSYGNMDMTDIPMGDFNLFGADNTLMNDMGNTDPIPFEAYININDAYEP